MAVATPEKLEELRRLCGEEVDKQLRSGGEWGLDEATLKRWLVARKGDVKEAAKDLQAHAAWRVTYVPRGRISEEEVREELDQKKAFLPGYDKEGRPLCLVVVRRHIMKDPEASKRYIAYSLDCATQMGLQRPGWDGKASGIFDLRGLKTANLDLTTLRNVFDLLQNHYPERLHKMWLFCAPVVFYGLWKLVYPFIDPITREKVKFVYEKDAAEEFAAAFDLDVLPPELQPAGTGQWVTVEQRYAMLLGGPAAAPPKELEGAAAPPPVPAGEAAAEAQQQREAAEAAGRQAVEVVA